MKVLECTFLKVPLFKLLMGVIIITRFFINMNTYLTQETLRSFSSKTQLAKGKWRLSNANLIIVENSIENGTISSTTYDLIPKKGPFSVTIFIAKVDSHKRSTYKSIMRSIRKRDLTRGRGGTCDNDLNERF